MAIICDDIPSLPPGWLHVADHKERWERLRVEAQQEAARLAGILVDQYGAKRVWLFGSAVGEWIFHDYSDVDLIVDGLDFMTFLRVWHKIDDLTKFQIDMRPRDDFTDERWTHLIPQPVLLAERGHEPDQGTG